MTAPPSNEPVRTGNERPIADIASITYVWLPSFSGSKLPVLYLSLALAVATFPAVPGSEQLESDILAIQAAKVDAIALDFSKCVAENIRAHVLRSDEKGDRGKAALFLESALAACDHTDATTRVRAGLASTKPEASSVDLDRQVGAAFAFPMLGLVMLLNESYEIGATSSSPEIPVEITPPGN